MAIQDDLAVIHRHRSTEQEKKGEHRKNGASNFFPNEDFFFGSFFFQARRRKKTFFFLSFLVKRKNLQRSQLLLFSAFSLYSVSMITESEISKSTVGKQKDKGRAGAGGANKTSETAVGGVGGGSDNSNASSKVAASAATAAAGTVPALASQVRWLSKSLLILVLMSTERQRCFERIKFGCNRSPSRQKNKTKKNSTSTSPFS